jgi:hypothetical protein
LLICRIIRAHSATTDVASRQPSNRYSPGTKHQDLELNARGSLDSIYCREALREKAMGCLRQSWKRLLVTDCDRDDCPDASFVLASK